jgi:hypothetical protein
VARIAQGGVFTAAHALLWLRARLGTRVAAESLLDGLLVHRLHVAPDGFLRVRTKVGDPANSLTPAIDPDVLRARLEVAIRASLDQAAWQAIEIITPERAADILSNTAAAEPEGEGFSWC